jgi:hypothetical protein
MFIGKRSNGIYFIEFFDSKSNSIHRISTGTRSKKLAQKFKFKLASSTIIEEPDNGLKISEFRDQYLKFAESTFALSYF